MITATWTGIGRHPFAPSERSESKGEMLHRAPLKSGSVNPVRGIAVASLLSVAAAAGVARADLRLEAEGESVCSIEPIAVRTAMLVGHNPFAGDARVMVRIAMTRTDVGVAARLTFENRDLVMGERNLEAADCAALTEKAAVVLAVAAREPSALVRRLPSIAAAAAPTIEVAAEVEPPTPRSADPSITRTLLLGAAGAAGSAGADARFIVGARVRRGARSAGLDLEVRAPETVVAGDMGRAHVRGAELTLAGCSRVLGVDGCLTVTAGALRGRGENVPDARVATTPSIAGGARVAWTRRLGIAIDLVLQADLRAYATTTEFQVDEMRVWKSSRFEGLLGIGVAAQVP